jgi:hypothetical protein
MPRLRAASGTEITYGPSEWLIGSSFTEWTVAHSKDLTPPRVALRENGALRAGVIADAMDVAGSEATRRR